MNYLLQTSHFITSSLVHQNIHVDATFRHSPKTHPKNPSNKRDP